MQSLSNLSQTYPSEEVRLLAADETRLLAAQHLQFASGTDVSALTESLRKLAPQDKLLRRDTQRFVQQALPPRPKSDAPARQRATIVQTGSIQLPTGTWGALVAVGTGFYAAGHADGKYIVARGTWSGQLQSRTHAQWIRAQRAFHDWKLIAVSERLGKVVLQGQTGHSINATAKLAELADHGPVTIGSHPSLGTNYELPFLLAMAYTDRGTFDLVRFHGTDPGEWAWSSYDAATDALLGTWKLRDFDITNDWLPPVVFRANQLYYGCGNKLHVQSMDGVHHEHELPAPIVRLALPAIHTRKRIIASLVEGGVMIFDDGDSTRPIPFSEGLATPHCCLTRGGLLVAAADGIIEVYDTRDGKLSLLANKAEPAIRPMAVAPTDSPLGFAVLNNDSGLTTFRLDGWRS